MLVQYISLYAILGAALAITKTQEELLIAISKNLMIKHCIVLDDEFNSKNFGGDFFPLIKGNTRANILTAFMTTEQLSLIIPRYNEIGDVYQPKTMIFIKTENLREVAKLLFRLKNEDFVRKFVWVLFFSYHLDQEELKFLYIPYNCQFLLINPINGTIFEILEIYNTQAFAGGRYASFFGVWQQDKEWHDPQTDFYQRRFNMNGSVLGVVARYVPNKCNHPILCQYEKIVAEFSRMMNFRPHYMNFQGLEDLQKNNSDIILEMYLNTFVFDIDYFRPHVVGPIWKSPAFLHIKFLQKYLDGTVEPYRRPFTLKLWHSIAGFTAVCTLAILFIYRSTPNTIRKNVHLVDALFLCLDSISNQSGSQFLSTISSRISLLASRFVPFFLIPAYLAAIVSFITVQHLNLPFDDLETLVQDGNFKITYQNETIAEIFLEKRNDEPGRIAKEKFLAPPSKMPLSVTEANLQMCNNSQLSYISFNNDVYFMEQECTILQIPKPIFRTWDAFMLREHSPYITIFNRILKTFISSGVLKKMEKIVYGTKPTHQKNSDMDPVELEALTIVYALLAIAYLLSIIIFFIEYIPISIKAKH